MRFSFIVSSLSGSDDDRVVPEGQCGVWLVGGVAQEFEMFGQECLEGWLPSRFMRPRASCALAMICSMVLFISYKLSLRNPDWCRLRNGFLVVVSHRPPDTGALSPGVMGLCVMGWCVSGDGQQLL